MTDDEFATVDRSTLIEGMVYTQSHEKFEELLLQLIARRDASPGLPNRKQLPHDERRRYPRFELNMPLYAVPLDQKLSPVDWPVELIARDASAGGISFMSIRAIDAPYLEFAEQLGSPQLAAVARVLSNRRFAMIFHVPCQYVARMLPPPATIGGDPAESQSEESNRAVASPFDDRSIHWLCSSCGRLLHAPKERAGRGGKCPTCKTQQTVPIK